MLRSKFFSMHTNNFFKNIITICIQNEKALDSFEKSTQKQMFTVNKEICSSYCHDCGVFYKFKNQFSAFRLRV